MLETSQPKLHKSSNGICKNCSMNRLETPEHLLLHCEKFSTSRQTAYDNISKIDAAFSNMDELRRITYFLNLQCPDECISLCCSFVSNTYKSRMKIEESIE